MRKIESIDLNIGQPYLSDWSEGMAIREFIANALDGASNSDTSIEKICEGKWTIINKESEIKPENFIIKEGEKTKNSSKIGKFGIGLKDAIGVLMSRGISVEIYTSEYRYVAKYKDKSKLINDKCFFMDIYKNDRDWIGTEIVLNQCKDIFIMNAKSYFLIYRKKPTIVSQTAYGDILSEDNKDNGTIYLNGIKIGHENTFTYSYNIKFQDENLKRGISRERDNLSREVYKESIKKIIEDSKDEEVFVEFYERFIKTNDGSLRGELVYIEAQVKAIKYAIKRNIKLVIFPTTCRGKLKNLLIQLDCRTGIMTIKILNKYYERLNKVLELIDVNIIADHYQQEYTELRVEELTQDKKDGFNMIYNFVKDNIPRNVISKVILVKENIYCYIQEETKMIIPINALSYIRDGCLRILSTIEESTNNGSNIKEELVKKYIDIEINKNS